MLASSWVENAAGLTFPGQCSALKVLENHQTVTKSFICKMWEGHRDFHKLVEN